MAFDRKEYMRLYRQDHTAEHVEGNRRWRQRHPEWHQEYGWKKQGIKLTNAEREILLAQQMGCCAICRRPESAFKQRLHVDHDHETGKVRGLLCAVCNWRVLTTVENYGGLIPIAMNYLNTHRAESR